MAHSLGAVRSEADILPAYRGTPVGELIGCHNLGLALSTPAAHPRILVATCLEIEAPLRVPPGFAIQLRTAAASLKRDPFKVSWAIGMAQVSSLAIVGHAGCGLTGLRDHRDQFVARLIENAGWERPAAEQHFDHWSDLFGIDDPVEFAAAEAARLQRRYPKIQVAPLMLDSSTGMLSQILP